MQVANAVRRFAKAIRHGDLKHQEWLLAAAEAFLKGEPMPRLPPSPVVVVPPERAARLLED